MHTAISEAGLDQVFRQARTHTKWQDRDVSDETLGQLYDLAKWGPTSMNCQPMRLVFVKSDEAKEKLVTALAAGNVDKVRAAPVTAIIGHDTSRMRQHYSTVSPDEVRRAMEQVAALLLPGEDDRSPEGLFCSSAES